MYKTGDILWGASRKIGNLWMVYHVGTQITIKLLWDGRNKRFEPDMGQARTDNIKTQLTHCDVTTAVAHIGIPFAQWPKWAILNANQYLNAPLVPPGSKLVPKRPGSVSLSPGVVSQVNRALGVTDEEPKAKGPKEAESCPKTSTGMHKYKEYTGLNESFEFCEHCDSKRSVRSFF